LFLNGDTDPAVTNSLTGEKPPLRFSLAKEDLWVLVRRNLRLREQAQKIPSYLRRETNVRTSTKLRQGQLGLLFRDESSALQ
jgi:hypothetical protein